jgi:hypothetical protein
MQHLDSARNAETVLLFQIRGLQVPKKKKTKRVLDSQFLSHLGMEMLASYHCTPMTVSMLSAIRLCN